MVKTPRRAMSDSRSLRSGGATGTGVGAITGWGAPNTGTIGGGGRHVDGASCALAALAATIATTATSDTHTAAFTPS